MKKGEDIAVGDWVWFTLWNRWFQVMKIRPYVGFVKRLLGCRARTTILSNHAAITLDPDQLYEVGA